MKFELENSLSSASSMRGLLATVYFSSAVLRGGTDVLLIWRCMGAIAGILSLCCLLYGLGKTGDRDPFSLDFLDSPKAGADFTFYVVPALFFAGFALWCWQLPKEKNNAKPTKEPPSQE